MIFFLIQKSSFLIFLNTPTFFADALLLNPDNNLKLQCRAYHDYLCIVTTR